MEQLLGVVQQLSTARDLAAVMEIVRTAARTLTQADGATLVLREGDHCYYADEDAIAPLWKGKRFPIGLCISGWSMLNRRSVVIEDIYRDQRVPADAYRPTFVRSLAMVPIRSMDPIGAIGSYWAQHYRASDRDISLLQALADATATAMENVRLHEALERRVADLDRSNRDLEAFAYVAAHDLQEPLRMVSTYVQLLERRYKNRTLDREAETFIGFAAEGAKRAKDLVDGLLALSRAGADGSRPMAAAVDEALDHALDNLRFTIAESRATVQRGSSQHKVSIALPELTRIFQNLIHNAIKFRSGEAPRIEISTHSLGNQLRVCVRDNGIGIPEADRGKLFELYRRLHPHNEFPGTGVGLAISRRIVERHGGRIWVDDAPGGGSTFSFTLPIAAIKQRDDQGTNQRAAET